MTTSEVQFKLKNVKSLLDFQEKFFSEDENGVITADFDIVYKTHSGYTDSREARIFDANGNCINSYIKCSDGYVPYPF